MSPKLLSTTPPLLKPRSTCFPRRGASRSSPQAMDRAELRLLIASCRGGCCVAAALRTAAADKRRRAAVLVNMLLVWKAWPCRTRLASDDATTNAAASLGERGRSLLLLQPVVLMATQRRTRVQQSIPLQLRVSCCAERLRRRRFMETSEALLKLVAEEVCEGHDFLLRSLSLVRPLPGVPCEWERERNC